MKKERWKYVRGYRKKYAVSDRGRVWRTPAIVGGVRVPGKMLVQWLRTGYWCVALSLHRKQRFVSVHRLLAIAFLPNPLNKPHVNHIDTDRTNCVLSNLEWATAKENARHAARMGRLKDKRGEGHHLAKMSDARIKKLIHLRKTKRYSQRVLGKMFGIGQPAVSRILAGARWGHLQLIREGR